MKDYSKMSREELLAELFDTSRPNWAEGLMDNDVGGESFAISPEESLDEVPEKFRHLLTDDIKKVFPDPCGHFVFLAERAELPAMKTWLRAIGDASHCCLQLNLGHPDSGMEDARFLFHQQDENKPQPIGDILLPDESVDPALPPLLQNLYSLVGSISTGGFGNPGELNHQPLPTAADMELHAFEGSPADLNQCHFVIYTPAKELLCVDAEHAYWYSLDGPGFYAGELLPVMNQYFQYLLNEAKFEPVGWKQP